MSLKGLARNARAKIPRPTDTDRTGAPTQLRFPAETASSALPRAAVSSVAGLEGEAARDLEFLTSEFMANAVLHAEGDALVEIAVTVEREPDRVRVTINDPQPGLAPDDDGWALYFVKLLSERWGVDPDGATTRIWFEIPLTRADREPAPHGNQASPKG